MTLTRAIAMPNGQPTKRIECSSEEETVIRAEWAKNDRLAAEEATKPKELTIKERLEVMQKEIDELKNK